MALKRLLAALLVGVLLVAATACSRSVAPAPTGIDLSKPPPQPVKIRAGWIVPGEDINYVMIKRPDILKYYGKWYTIEWFQFQGSTPQALALVAGTLDAATMAPITLAQSAEKTAVNAVITGEQHAENKALGTHGTTWMVLENSPIKSVKDLKGKTVAINVFGATPDYVLRTMLKRNGLEPGKDVKIVELGFGLQEEALRKGQIDVGYFPLMYRQKALANGGVRILFEVTDVLPEFIHSITVFSRDFAEQNPGAVQAFQADFRVVADFLYSHRAEAIQASADVTKVPADLLQTFAFTDQDYYRPRDGMPDLKVIQANWDFFYNEGYLKQRPDVNQYVLPELLRPLPAK